MDENSDPEISPSDCCGSVFDEQKFIKFHKLYWQIHCNEHISVGTTRLPRDVKSYCETSAAATKEENISRQITITPLCVSKITLQNPKVTNHVDVPPDVVQRTEPPNTQLSPRSPDVVAPMICEVAESPKSFDANPVSLIAEETSKQVTLEKQSGSAKVLNREDSSYITDLAASMNSSTTGRNSSQSSLTSSDEGLVTGHSEDALDGTLSENKSIPASQQPVDSCGDGDALLCGSRSDSTVTHNSSSSTSTLNASCGSVVGSSNQGPVAGGIDTSVPGYRFLPEDSRTSLFFVLPCVDNASEVPQSVPLINTTSTVADHVISQSQMQAGITELEDRVLLLLIQSLVSQNADAVTLYHYINLLSHTVTSPTAGVVAHDNPIAVTDGHSQSQDSDWTEEQKTNCIRNLQIANSCTDASCSDDNCSFWKEMIEDIESSVRNNNVNNLQRQILNIIADHAADCSEIFCCVPWCFFYTHCDRSDRMLQHAALCNYYRAIDFQSEMNLLTQNYESPGPAVAGGGGTAGDYEAEQPEFIQIDSQVAWPSIEFEYDRPYPVVQLDFSLHYVSLIKQGRITCHGQSYTIPLRQLLIEQYTLMEDSASGEMWRRFKESGGQHRNIVGHFWCLLTAPIVKVCVDYSHVIEGRNLQNCLRQQGRTYSWPVICRYIHGLVSATQFLHDAEILFLRWTASSIYVSADGRHAMLGDLSCAVHLETILDDRDSIDVVKYCLPPHIIPPEMFSGDIDFASDVWGIGCLLYEVVNGGLPLHYQHRHLPRDELRDYVENYNINNFQRTMTNDLLRQIFVVDNNRIILSDVAAYLEDWMECD